MADGIYDKEDRGNTETLRSRRAVLKMIASAPLVVSFGMLASPMMRYLKPTMQPGNFFQEADLPGPDQPPLFCKNDLPEIWNCIPFTMPLKYLVFSPEQYEIRKIPAFIIRTDTNKFVAYSRICPHRGCQYLNYRLNTADHCCGCPKDKGNCGCISVRSKTPLLICPCCQSAFDVNNGGRVLSGPARRPPRQFELNYNGNSISIGRLEQGNIA